MGKKEPRIVIAIGDEPPEPNNQFLALLRDGEKHKPGDARGTLADRLGGELRDFLATQTRAAQHGRSAVKGTFTVTLSFTSGADGSHPYTCETKIKTAKIPPKPSMIFTDEDGEMIGRPAEPLTDLAYKREAESKASADPKVGAASNL